MLRHIIPLLDPLVTMGLFLSTLDAYHSYFRVTRWLQLLSPALSRSVDGIQVVSYSHPKMKRLENASKSMEKR